MRKIIEIGRDELNALVYECVAKRKAIRLGKDTGKVGYDSILAGDWIAYYAKAEEVKRFTKVAKKDLMDRQLRGASYAGDIGHVVIGGHRFSLYPKSMCLVRDDFVTWAESAKNWDSVLTPTGKIRESTKPIHQEDVKVDELMHIWKDMRGRALKLQEPTKLMRDGEWNTVFDMRRTLTGYMAELETARKAGCFYPVSKMQADLIAGLIAYRERQYSDSVDFFLSMGATAIKVARWIQETHSKTEEQGK